MKNIILIIFSLNFLLIHSSITLINNNNVVYKKEIDACFDAHIEIEASESNNNCASPLITNNTYLDSSISNVLLTFDNVYYNTTICVECIKVICKERVIDTFFNLFDNRTRILRLNFFEMLGNNLILTLNTTNLRGLDSSSLRKQIFGVMMNQSFDDIDNCAYRYRNVYLSNVKFVQEVFKEYQNITCANDVYLKQINDTFNAWKQELGRLLNEEGQKCLNQMQLNDTVIEAIKNICKDDENES